MADVDVVIVGYNSADVLGACIDSIADAASVTVVDNASNDDTAACARSHPRVTVIETGRNLGFAAAANRGAAVGAAEMIFFLNPDATLMPGAIEKLAAAMDHDPGLAIAGPLVRNADGSVYPSARRVPPWGEAVGHAFLGLVWPKNRFSLRYKFPETPEWIAGTAMVVRRSVFDRLGGFDERYFMYVEDVDLCWRARAAGGRVGLVAGAEVVHLIGRSTEHAPYRMIVAHSRSLLRFAVKTTTGARRLLLPLAAVGLVARTLAAVVQRAARGRPHAAP